MSEAEFERRLSGSSILPSPVAPAAREEAEPAEEQEPPPAEREPAGRGSANGSGGSSRSRSRGKAPAKPKRVQRMFAIEEDLDKKLWLYAIHVGKDRSDVINDLLRPVVASMVLYDSRDRRSGRSSESDGDGGSAGD
jgi:hypothetical protein